MSMINVRLDDITVPPNRTRKVKYDAALDDLTKDIQRNGMQSPIGVSPELDGKFKLIYGARRLAAHRKAGIEQIQARVFMVDDDNAHLMEVTENLMREELSRLERAAHFAEYVRVMRKMGFTYDDAVTKAAVPRKVASKHVERINAAANAGAALMGEPPINMTKDSPPEVIEKVQEQAAPIVEEVVRRAEEGLSDRYVAPVEPQDPNTVTVRVNFKDPKQLPRWFRDHIGDGEKLVSTSWLRVMAFEITKIADEYDRERRRRA